MALVIEEEKLRIGRSWIPYVIVISILYLLYGILQLYNGVVSWWLPWAGSEIQLGIEALDTYIPKAFPDPFSGLSLIVAGLLFVRAIIELHNSNTKRAFAFLFAGWLLAIILMILNVLVLLADVLDVYYPLLWGGSVEKGWTLAGDPWGIAPHLVLGVLTLLIYWSSRGFKEMVRGLTPK